jgi:aspartyl-tRNA(Asn)/glutamyl-tRNA(Gln) amidotransferase subunit B
MINAMHPPTHWEAVIGLEVHIQLLTQSKLFSSAATRYGAPPNSQASATDLGLPGTLPVLNQEVIRMAIMFGLSIQASIAAETAFSRKHYFYPDLPKGYQITQHDQPIVGAGGYLTIETATGETKPIRITRAHLEEDAGKSLHAENASVTQTSRIDLNRAGVPLLEIVSAPDLCNAQEAVSYLKNLHTLVRYLGICDGNMQEGSFRCDANVSVRKKGDTRMGVRAEIKNLNSFRFIEKAINAEISRQIQSIEQGEILRQETRLYDEALNETRKLRKKDSIADYRYFPDPDLCPLPISAEWIQAIAKNLPELPAIKQARFQSQYALNTYDAELLISYPALAHYFETVIQQKVPPKLAANWITGELAAALNQNNLDITQSPISAERLSQLLKRIEDGTLSGPAAKTVFEKLWTQPKSVDKIIQQEGLQQITDPQVISTLITQVLTAHPTQVAAYLAGKTKLLGFFVGQVMQRSKGRCHPPLLNELLKQQLDKTQ